MSERPAKSIFAHKQTYSRKGNSKNRSVSDIAHEAERLDGACPHVVEPQPPAILEGIRASEIIDLIENRVAEQNKRLRQLRKETPDRKDEFRGIRTDTHVMIASVFSFPDAVTEMDEEEYLRWRTDVIAFAKADAALNGAEVLSIIEHRDESHPHVHVLAVPVCADDNMRMDAKRCHEGHREQDKHKENNWPGSPSRSYKQAMRGWQDRYTMQEWDRSTVRHAQVQRVAVSTAQPGRGNRSGLHLRNHPHGLNWKRQKCCEQPKKPEKGNGRNLRQPWPR